MDRAHAVTASQGAGLVDLLDRLLAVGVTVSGDVVIRLADVDLINLDLRLLLATAKGTPAHGRGETTSPPGVRSVPAPLGHRTGRLYGPAWPQAPERRAGELEPSAASLDQGLGRLVVAVVELVRQLLERQAIRRKRAGTLDPGQLDRLGDALRTLELQTAELRTALGVPTSDLDRALCTIEDVLHVADAAAAEPAAARRAEEV